MKSLSIHNQASQDICIERALDNIVLLQARTIEHLVWVSMGTEGGCVMAIFTAVETEALFLQFRPETGALKKCRLEP